MELGQIAAFVIAGLIYLLVLPSRWRKWALLIGSMIAIYWLQPTLNIRWLDYSLPTATLGITIVCWLVTRQSSTLLREDWQTLALVIVIALLLTISRYMEIPIELTSRPPETWQVAVCLLVLTGAIFVLRNRASSHLVISIVIILITGLFILLKTESLTVSLSHFLRGQTGQDQSLATVIDIQWLGFSYIAFRLIHTLRDRQSGLLPELSLREYLTYVIFFPAYAAGPIDRAERFATDYRALSVTNMRDANKITVALTRITVGLFKKFVIADGLAYFSLNTTNIAQANSAGAMWILLYSYAIRLYFDFSGYSDIAIGIGMLFGIQLPENFNLPYLKNNITTFWQSWHMTLSNWVRSYVYSPLSRNLLRRKNKPSNNVIILICTLTTMVIIGLWHGVTLPFVIWGLWHGIGLFLHKLWSDRTRGWYRRLKQKPVASRLWYGMGVMLTFHFVLLGWVWFAMPDMASAFHVFSGLLGLVR
ncbi:MAG: MBOAT family O-acyltransferase [Chloroflexota bacterium]